ncbi:teashirt homolog 1 [Austrofundulus limnaeus]|uniref:Teashirt homolog 1 n=1 Tax=Austrofundulus limnaeus TaxID=52670 RepID=A0A2I4B9C3_AUSLI|nr:PREDICTED: teashirt homolog 1 [Austrofundulus limnaeus]XP_013864382.1 PREDICTED: teashirt homolog 1 [Austrofundulus limnaeus]XP_013864383.1 PREDICTED: teashirt homolog 1 [Austrofundulus limnaeus]
MPRRKQQEPRRSAAYMPEDELKTVAHDEEEHLQDDGLSLDGQDTEFLCNEEEEDVDGGQPPSYRDSPLSNGTNPDAGYGSPLSDASDRLADFKSTSSRDGQEREGLALPFRPNNGLSFQDSLAKMKAVYANLISDASWSSITMDIMKSKPAAAAGSVNATLPTPESVSAASASSTTTTNKSSGINMASSHHNSKSSAVTVNHAGSVSANTNGTTASSASNHSAISSSGSSSGGASNGSGVAYDWHQAALAKTLQQTPYHLLPEPSLFSTVQLYRQNNKLYGSVFTGASKFRCKDCSAAYDTLVGLTVHMNETGHYRDDNKDKEEDQGKRWSKPRKRSLMEMEGKEDAQKVLKCMYCGHSFESLQDLSVHMIKTKHYQKVPLKEPVPALATKLVPTSAKKRAIQEAIVSPCSPDSVHAGSGGGSVSLGDLGKDSKAAANPYVTPNNRYGYQNGASYTWQFEARKAQILKCMECGSSHDTLQQLTAHMMVTGHFLKVTNSASKKGKQLVFDPVVEEKIQSIPLPPTTTRLPVPSSVKSQPVSPALSSGSEEKREGIEDEKVEGCEPVERKIKEEKDDSSEKSETDTTSYKYLREEDLEETPKEGLDILKSLENTVSSAISKAQTGTPTWGGYPSIHAAYQLQGAMKSSATVLPSTVQSVQMQPMFNSGLRGLVSNPNSVIHSPRSPSSPTPLRSNVSAMEELVEKVTGKPATIKKEKEEKMVSLERCRPPSVVKSPSPALREHLPSPNDLSVGKSSGMRSVSPGSIDSEIICKKEPKESLVDGHNNHSKNGSEACRSPVMNGSSLGIITDHSPESPFISPLSALQSIMNTHLGKASKPVGPAADPLSMLYKISNSMIDKPAFNPTQGKSAEPTNHYQLYENDDQPIDLSKNKSTTNTNSNNNNSSCMLLTNNSVNGNKPLISLPESVSSPLRENALMDISDMVKNLTGRLTPKSSTPSSISEKSDADGSAFEDALEDLSPVQKRKGRQSNWNPQHLLILQAQFASSLRETPEGRYAMTDLGPQERVHICKFTGLSMTTISHWLANVKYQLRRTGGTKFLKNMDSCQPVFLCGDCASQFRTPSSYISHLESHLGFSLKDLSKLSAEHLREQQAASKVITDKMTFGSPLSALTTPEDDTGSVYQCRLCNRTFVSKHAVKLHLSKTHGKSPEDHLVFVTALEKLEKLDKM